MRGNINSLDEHKHQESGQTKQRRSILEEPAYRGVWTLLLAALILDENCENDEMKRGAVVAVRAIHVVGDSRDSLLS